MPKDLLWKFEAFREYLSYEVLQPAAAVLNLFEGELITEDNPRIKKLESLLSRRTGKYSWKPKRSGTPDLNWNSEGDFTRNKERLLTSMFIMYPKEFENGHLRLTKFGKALASGKVKKNHFYDHIIKNFRYPHPAYNDNWKAWIQEGRELRPFIFILQVMLSLYKIDPNLNFLSVKEAEFILLPISNHDQVEKSVNDIISARKNQSLKDRKSQGDKITRKITDIFGFLCISGYTCYLENNDISLNLHGIHTEELTHYLVQRCPPKKIKESKIEMLESIVNGSNQTRLLKNGA